MKKGFTLAEVLITLAVIGVVATLTMPNLIGNYQNRVLMSQLQKTINSVQNAVVRSMEDRAAESFEDVVSSRPARKDFFKTYFDTVNICDVDTGYNNCLAQTYTSFDKSAQITLNDSLGWANAVCATTTSSATICIAGKNNMYYSGNMRFYIDVNGIKPPNINGKDLFYFRIFNNGKIGYNYKYSDGSSFGNHGRLDPSTEEAAGNYCLVDKASPKENTCLPYIISHGWQFKY